jgi:hypothetical protein
MTAKTNEQRLLLKYGTITPNEFGKVYIIPPRDASRPSHGAGRRFYQGVRG